MRTFTHKVEDDDVSIRVVEEGDSLADFERFIKSTPIIGLDSETSDLNIYRPDHVLRLVQFGSVSEAWVLRWDTHAPAIRSALADGRAFVAHNATFDLLTLDRHGAASLDDLGPRTVDTRILGHLLDPRMKHEGGTGLKLAELAEIYVDADAIDADRALTAEFRKLGATKATGFAVIPFDNEPYLRYGGLDVVYVSRLYAALVELIRDSDLGGLSEFEHLLQRHLADMQRRGVLLDVPYIEQLQAELESEEAQYNAIASDFGVEKVNSTKQVTDALLASGEKLTAKTPVGAYKADAAVLQPLADLNDQWERLGVREPNPVAEAVLHAKRASKWRKSYLDAFLNLRDGNGRLHASINGLQARTARMSISSPPLQQLPSGDATIRRALVADPGQSIIAADYSQVEMRVLAAMCEDETLVKAILDGADLHSFTAERVYGADFTPRHRDISKAIGFGKVYGGGLKTIVRQTGAPAAQVREAIDAYDQTFPGIKRYGNTLQRRARFGKREVVTPSGRRLPLDRDRLYSATNYVVQSTARDLLAQAIVDCYKAGLGEHLLLPVHDELIAQAPESEAQEVIRAISEAMESNFRGIPITSDPEVFGPSWGHGYL